MVRVLTNDGLQKQAIENLEALGFEVVNNHYDKNILGKILDDFDVLVIRSVTKVSKEILDDISTNKLKLIIRAGVGIDNIDISYANNKGIVVKNTPNASSDSVSELVIGHMLAIARFIGISNYTMRNGEWNKKRYQGIELKGKTLGIIGMGRIGKSLAKKAEALELKVIYNDILGKQDNLSYEFMELNDLLRKSEFISLHVPYDKINGALIGKYEFSIMKDGACIINCARGKVIDEEALVEALDSGKILGAGIDVFEQEPTNNKKLLNHSNVSITPHIGAATKEAQDRIGDEVVEIIVSFFNK